jgi:hypothetical protein
VQSPPWATLQTLPPMTVMQFGSPTTKMTLPMPVGLPWNRGPSSCLQGVGALPHGPSEHPQLSNPRLWTLQKLCMRGLLSLCFQKQCWLSEVSCDWTWMLHWVRLHRLSSVLRRNWRSIQCMIISNVHDYMVELRSCTCCPAIILDNFLTALMVVIGVTVVK